MDTLLNWDHWLFHKINSEWTNSFFDWFMPWITDLHHRMSPWWIFLMLVLNAFWIYHYRRRLVRIVLASALAFALSDATAYRIIKPLVSRDRPEKTGISVVLRVKTHSGQSFPSNHAANTFAVANVVGFYFPPARWVAFPLAALVAYSRVYVGVHFPIDVLSGALLGLILSSLMLFALTWGDRLIAARRKRPGRRTQP